jgi:NAD+ diphosphatase
MKFNFCPLCAKKLSDQEIGDEGMVPFCESCQRPFFDSFETCVIIGVINEHGEIALIKQSYVSKDNWVLVAGYVKKGDLAEETVKKEVKEEIGHEAKAVHYLQSYYHPSKELLMLGFAAFVDKRLFLLSNEVDEVAWFSIADAMKLVREGSIAQEHVKNIKKLLNG